MFSTASHFSIERKYSRFLSGVIIFSLIFNPFFVLGQEIASSTSTDSHILTGDALAQTEVQNGVNGNEISQESPTSTETNLLNNAGVENTGDTSGETGGNTVSADGTIVTGDAYAGANVLNVANTNIVDSFTLFYLLNSFLGLEGNIDLRNFQNASTTSSSTPCGSSECSGSLDPSVTTINASSTASISNSLVVRAQTGQNQAGENGLIQTGNAYAGANVINVANTNIIDSNYLLFTFNNFGGWGGDLVLPNEDFFRNFFFKNNSTPSGATINANNTAEVNNSVSTEAGTGNNQGGNTLLTGDATSGTNIFNTVNQNLLGGSKLHILVRVHGNWLGNVFNAPSNVSWQQTPSGVEVFGEGGGAQNGNFSNLNLNTHNTASVSNNVQVQALTGENKITGAGNISTGNAYAGVNIINVVNSNVIGQNWIFAILNIFGDWSGNISFGQPDLWLGSRVETFDKVVGPNSLVRFHYTIVNRGDAKASGVRLQNISDHKEFISFKDGYNYYDPRLGKTSWDIGTIPAGGIVEVSYDARISPEIPFKDTLISSVTNLSLNETDGDVVDNKDEVTLSATNYVPGWDGVKLAFTPDPKLVVTKTNDIFDGVTGTTTVNYKIVIKNEGGIAHYATLVDTLKNELGEVFSEQTWELGDIYPNEEIEVTYTSVFNKNTPMGVYTNYAQVKAIGRHESLTPFYGAMIDSNIASSSITMLPAHGWAPQNIFAAEEKATSTPPAITSSTGRFIKPTPVLKETNKDIISQTPPFTTPDVPFSPLVSKVLAFQDPVKSSPNGGGSQGAAAFSALGFHEETTDFFLLLVALLLSITISNLLSRTRLRNAFTSF